MKKLLLLSLLLSAYSVISQAQQGLENVIVEKYYISDANDATVNSMGGVLPVGSVTYRVYLDMLPDYKFQSSYGDPAHECRIETSTLFFNNEDRGAVNPTFNFNYCDDNTVMLDSWLSVGAAANGHFGIMKVQDDGVGTVVNGDGVLQNNDTAAGIPLTVQDGLLAGTPEAVISAGIGTEMMVFDAQNDGTNGPVFSTTNGAWASVLGSAGPDPVLNQVLIMQITTDGVFSFSLNVQIRNEITLGVENYVASLAVGSEIEFPALNYNSSSSIDDVDQAGVTFGIYPVPAKNSTTLTINATRNNQPASYVLYDLLGNKVSEKVLGAVSGVSNHIINLSELTAGIYFVELNVGGFVSTKKIIKN